MPGTKEGHLTLQRRSIWCHATFGSSILTSTVQTKMQHPVRSRRHTPYVRRSLCLSAPHLHFIVSQKNSFCLRLCFFCQSFDWLRMLCQAGISETMWRFAIPHSPSLETGPYGHIDVRFQIYDMITWRVVCSYPEPVASMVTAVVGNCVCSTYTFIPVDAVNRPWLERIIPISF